MNFCQSEQVNKCRDGERVGGGGGGGRNRQRQSDSNKLRRKDSLRQGKTDC